jgi:hypothetical protein
MVLRSWWPASRQVAAPGLTMEDIQVNAGALW